MCVCVCRKYEAATQDDLWRFLTTQAHQDGTLASDITVKQIMDTWTLQMGYPVVKVERNYQDGTAQISQVSPASGRDSNPPHLLPAYSENITRWPIGREVGRSCMEGEMGREERTEKGREKERGGTRSVRFGTGWRRITATHFTCASLSIGSDVRCVAIALRRHRSVSVTSRCTTGRYWSAVSDGSLVKTETAIVISDF